MKKVRGWFWRVLLSSRTLRARVAWQLKNRYPGDLDARVPIGEELASPLFDQELGASFAEIFLLREYAPLLEAMPPARRWIDLGCYAGFFSLWMEWQRRRAGQSAASEALLLDANPALARPVERLIAINGLAPAWRFRGAAIAGGSGQCDVVQRTYMGSSLRSVDSAPGRTISIPIATEADLLASFTPPFDLMKVDIEGAEFDLLQHYPRLVGSTRWLCLEWHSWHAGGGGVGQLHALAETHGFELACEVQLPRRLSNGSQTGVLLFHNVTLPADAHA